MHGLPARTTATVRLTSVDAAGTTWTASARYRADAHGTIDLARSAPLAGYGGAWEMGLTALLRPWRHLLIPVYRWDGARPATFRVAVLERGRVVARTSYRRRVAPAPLRLIDATLARDGFVGFYFAPSTHPRTAVLLIGGSEGGLSRTLARTAAQLAAHGCAALAVGYFALPGLPATLARIPLEYFVRAIRWLQRRSGLPGPVAVVGASRGSEAALLLGAHFPSLVGKVVGVVPSAVVNPSYPDGTTSAWSLAGRPLPDTPFTAADTIPVERIQGPLMTICAGADDVWPSCVYAAEIGQRRRRYGVAAHDLAVTAPGASHVETATLVPDVPGVAGGERDRERIWPQLLRFLGAAP